MNIQDFLEEMKTFQKSILSFLFNENNTEEECFENLKGKINDFKKYKDKYELKSFFRLLLRIVNNHQRYLNFFDKVEKIILLFEDQIKKLYSSSEIFNIFKSNKRILLFLISNQILKVDSNIIDKMISVYKSPQYFLPEIKEVNGYNLNSKFDIEITEDFNEKRKIGENDNVLCNLIRNDSVKDFISYVTKNNISLNCEIKPSIFETNSFLIRNEKTTLIEYAAFHGSIQIFKYLNCNNAKITPSLFLYAIHGQNMEIINLLEGNKIDVLKSLKESIKCHHIDITYYIINNYIEDIKKNAFQMFIFSLEFFNFTFIQVEDFIYKSTFFYLCKYDHYDLVNIFLEKKYIDINLQIISFYNFYSILIYSIAFFI